ncbi:MAG: hypothetical protein B6242_05635 [Anaerolineaceae bacterium 4572_78]|nr:MAG: hypothetical protein B6242_05635 [Anaerolineaceae bacterium 4572_78]
MKKSLFGVTKSYFVWLILIATIFIGNQQWIMSPIKSNGDNHDAVIINEVMADNKTTLADEDGDYSDWLELYNRRTVAVNLFGWALTDDPQQPDKWLFPDIVLPGNSYLIVFTSGKDRQKGELHANFKLSKHGEFLALYNSTSRKFMDSIDWHIPKQFADMSYGHTDAGVAYFAKPTPNQPNDTMPTWQGLVNPVQFSMQRGMYHEPFHLVLNTDTYGADIYYTLDGSKPHKNSTVYQEQLLIDKTTLVRAIAVKTNFYSSTINTHSYIFLPDVLNQPVRPAGFPATWGGHIAHIAGYSPGYPATADYEMDPLITHDPQYHELLKEGLYALPIVSLVTDMTNYDIHANPREHGREWERPVSMELVYPNGEHVQVNAGFRTHGGVGRFEAVPKHSFRIIFRRKYGTPTFHYPLFPNSPVQMFDNLVLRGGGTENYSYGSDDMRKATTFTRDQWLRDMQIEMSGVGSHGIFVHLYLNGLYWGLYNLVERPDETFMKDYFGGKEDDWFIYKSGEHTNGDESRYELLQKLVSSGTLTNATNYQNIQSFIDVTHFADYLILNWYAGNVDWPHNNWYASLHNPHGQLRFFMWDGERIWEHGAVINEGNVNRSTHKKFVSIRDGLLSNADFRMLLADRMYKHLFHDGLLSTESVSETWATINEVVRTAVVAETARWGDVKPDWVVPTYDWDTSVYDWGLDTEIPPITHADWLTAYENVRQQIPHNGEKLIALAREKDYYPPLDPPHFSQHGGLILPNTPLSMTSTGIIYYTTDGSDPRIPYSSEIQPHAHKYTMPIVLTKTTHIKARSFVSTTWSALHEATFLHEPVHRKIVISEIMYHPPDGDQYEFIKLKNVGNIPYDLTLAHFEGIDYMFPAGTVLSQGACLVLVKDAASFQQRYDTDFFAIYQGRLSNKGETIILKSMAGEMLSMVTYDDENGWALSADGHGDSLILIDEHGDINHPHVWQASKYLHGSPQDCF